MRDSTPSRDPSGRWQRGIASPNPGGIPRGTAGLIERARRLALSYAPRAIKTLADLLGDGDPRVRVAAAEGLLDRAGLKPFSLEPERVEVTATVDVDALRAALAARLAGLAAAREVEVEARRLPDAGRGPGNNVAQTGAVPDSEAGR